MIQAGGQDSIEELRARILAEKPWISSIADAVIQDRLRRPKLRLSDGSTRPVAERNQLEC